MVGGRMTESGGTVEPDDEEPFVLGEEFRPYFSDEPLPAHLLPVTGESVDEPRCPRCGQPMSAVRFCFGVAEWPHSQSGRAQ